MLICNHCGTTAEEVELMRTRRGDPAFDEPLVENYYDYRCKCGGEFVEAIECKICGEPFAKSEKHHRIICESCLDDYKTLDNALLAGEFDKFAVHINGFVKFALPPEVINRVLTDYVKSTLGVSDERIAKYCEKDEGWFYEFMVNHNKLDERGGN